MAQHKQAPANPETVICSVLAETISAGALAWEGGGSKALMLQWMANQCLAKLYEEGYQVSRRSRAG